MVWLAVCGLFASIAAFVLTLRAVMGDNSETRALRARLRSYGVETRRFSSQCLTELIEVETRHLQFSETPVKRELAAAIGKVAADVRNISLGTQFFSAAELEAEAKSGHVNHVWEILAKHDPQRFALPYLERTQELTQPAAPLPGLAAAVSQSGGIRQSR